MKLYGVLYNHNVYQIEDSKCLIKCLNCEYSKEVNKHPESIKGEFIHDCNVVYKKIKEHDLQIRIKGISKAVKIPEYGLCTKDLVNSLT